MEKLINNIRAIQSSPFLSMAFIGTAFFAILISYSLGLDWYWTGQTLSDPETPGTIAGVADREDIEDLMGPYTVDRVIDGDTVRVFISGESQSIRLIGIDTPELSSENQLNKCFAQQAKGNLEELLSGNAVYLERDPTQQDKDRYDRLLRYIYVEEGEEGGLVNANEVMVADGFAYEYTYRDPYKYTENFKEAENFARENNIGLWGEECEQF